VRAKDALGRFGEDLAAQHLREAGFVVLERNWRCAAGEIDILARDGDTLVVCEVKTRTTTAFGAPIEAVTPEKVERLRRLAFRWTGERGIRPARIRIDVVGVLRPRSGPTTLEHFRGLA